MSNSAGTLQTTHQATYIPPRMMPGYKGHCPTVKFDYGETYGNATAKYFQLNQSKSSYAKGGQFPTVYTHNPDLVIHARDRSREQWRTVPKYELTNVNHDRREEINKFDTLAQGHRQFYKDRTGTVPRVDDFLIPKSAEDMYRQDIKSGEEQVSIESQAKMNKMLNQPVMRTPKTASTTSRGSTVRDRAMRDVVFESR